MHGSFSSHHFYHKWVTSDTHKDYHDVSHNQEDICCVHPHCKSKRCGTYIKLTFLLFQWIWKFSMEFSIFLLTRCFSHLLYPQLRHLVWQFHHSFSVPMSFLSGCFRYQTLHGFISLSQVALSKVASSFLLFLLTFQCFFCFFFWYLTFGELWHPIARYAFFCLSCRISDAFLLRPI